MQLLQRFIDKRKTMKEKQDEERLLQELLEVVSLRNNIVDSIEVDRLRCVHLNIYKL